MSFLNEPTAKDIKRRAAARVVDPVAVEVSLNLCLGD